MIIITHYPLKWAALNLDESNPKTWVLAKANTTLATTKMMFYVHNIM